MSSLCSSCLARMGSLTSDQEERSRQTQRGRNSFNIIRTAILYGMRDVSLMVVTIASANLITNYLSLNKQSPRLLSQFRHPEQAKDETMIISKLQRLLNWPCSRTMSAKVKNSSIIERLSIVRVINNRVSLLEISHSLSDPPPLLFLLAVTAFTLAFSYYRYTHRDDRYQDQILGLALGIGVFAAAWHSHDFWTDIKGYMAWSTVLAMFISGIGHWLFGRKQEVEDEDDVKAKQALREKQTDEQEI